MVPSSSGFSSPVHLHPRVCHVCSEETTRRKEEEEHSYHTMPYFFLQADRAQRFQSLIALNFAPYFHRIHVAGNAIPTDKNASKEFPQP
jgi:hypothetical protein